MWKKTSKALILCLLILSASPGVAMAAQSSSNNYQVNEVFFGSGGELNACSTNFCSKQSAGETAVGSTSSADFRAQAGFNTDRTPYLEFLINTSNLNLGTLTPNTTQTATATFSVKTYLAHGYQVVTAADPPTNGSYTMQTLATPTASSAGTEQFGINLVANTSPVTFGADPIQVPDSSFSFGTVDANYGTTNLYKYTKGDTVAGSTKSSGETDYTISYIFNVSNLTPGGTYTMNHVLVVTSTF